MQTSDFNVGASETWVQTITSGRAVSGWTSVVFVVKRSRDTEGDDEALVVVRETNPGAGDDGLILLDGQDVDSGDHDQADIVVSNAGSDLVMALTLHPLAMKIPAGDWVWDAFIFTATDKYRAGTGKFSVSNTTWRGLTAP